MSLQTFVHKTVAVLGASYGGRRTAQLLAQQLPGDWRVVLIDRNTHMNHLYALPRFAVLAGHEHKAFIPYTNAFGPPEAFPTTEARTRHLFINAQITSLKEHSLTLDRAFPEYGIRDGVLNFDFAVYALGSHLPAPINLWGPVGDEEGVKVSKPEADSPASVQNHESVAPDVEKESRDDKGVPAESSASAPVESSESIVETLSKTSTRTFQPPLANASGSSAQSAPEIASHSPSSPANGKEPRIASSLIDVRGTKPGGINWLKRFRARIEKASSILVVGGGALGIQYASDIAEVFPNKSVTLLHSRQRLLPKFDERMHDEILSTLSSLNVTTILGERLDLSFPGKTVINDQGHPERVVRTQSGREIRAELVLLCTGQKPNTTMMQSLIPESIVPEGASSGLIRVKRTLQIGVPVPPTDNLSNGLDKLSLSEDEHEKDPNYTSPYPHLFAIGDAADAFGAIKAGHTAYFQGEVAARNILKMIELAKEGKEWKEEDLERYTPGPPAIKISLGLTKSLFQYNGVVGKKSDVSEDLDTPGMWKYMDLDVSEEDMLTL